MPRRKWKPQFWKHDRTCIAKIESRALRGFFYRCAIGTPPILNKPTIGRNNMAPVFLLLSALGGFISVALGAFAAHGLRERLEPPLLAVFQTGVQYQMYHALALLGVALWLRLAGTRDGLKDGGRLVVLGVLLRSDE